MKTPNLLTVLVTVLLSSSTLFARAQQQADNISSALLMVDKLDNDVQLADSQKVTMQKIAEEYIDKRREISDSESEESAFLLRKEAEEQYKMALDSLLSNEQRIALQARQKERRLNGNSPSTHTAE